MTTGDRGSPESAGGTDYQNFTRTDSTELWERVGVAQHRFTDLVSRLDPIAPVADSDWTVREVGVHLLSVLSRYTDRDLRGRDGLADDAPGVTALNRMQMRTYGDLSSVELVEVIGSRIDCVRTRLPATQDLAERFPFHCDVTLDAAGFLGNLISEFLVHGRDVARANGEGFDIDRRDAVLILNCLVQLPAGFMRADAHPVKLGLRIRGAIPWVIDMRPGTAESRPMHPRETTDVVLRGSPAAMVLALHGRYSAVEALYRGLLPTGGRKPWRALHVPANIDSP